MSQAKASILLVEDEEHLLDALKLNLELEGYEVTTAGDGVAALKAVENEYFDLIIMDVMMPEMDGLATLKQLQDNPQVKDIPVIFLTAKTQKADRRRFYASGIKGFITKPFDPTTLASQISGFLGW